MAALAFRTGDYDATIRFASECLQEEYDFTAWKYYLLANMKLQNFQILASIIDSLDEEGDPHIATVKFATLLHSQRYDEAAKIVRKHLKKYGMDKTCQDFKVTLDTLGRSSNQDFIAWQSELGAPALASTFWRVISTSTKKPQALARPPRPKKIYVDITGTIQNLCAGLPPTGIQRACVSILMAMGEIENGIDDIHVAFRSDWTGAYLGVTLREFLDVLTGREGRTVREYAALRGWMQGLAGMKIGAWRTLHPISPARNDVFFFPDAFWGPHLWSYRTIIETYGCKTATLIHDLITLKDPTENAGLRFNKAFKNAVNYAITATNVVIVQSNATRQDVLSYAKEVNRDIKLQTIAFGDDNLLLKFHTSPAEIPENLFSKRYVLSVGTLSKRKGFLQLAQCFEKMLGLLPNDAALVFCGRWNADLPEYELLQRIISRNPGRIVHIQSPNDDQLEELYSRCYAFSLLSTDEGWGMPVSEAILQRKPLLLSHSGSLPEVGGDLAIYVDPRDLPKIENALVSLYSDLDLARNTDAAYSRHRARTWGSTARKILTTLNGI